MRNTFLAGMVSLMLVLGGCSSSSTTSTDADLELGDEVPVTEASTDAIPPAGDQADLPPPVEEMAADPAPEAAPMDAVPPADTVAEAAPPAPEEPMPPAPEEPAPPSPEMAAAAPTGPTESHTVKSGDTLMKIAFEVYGDIYQWRKIYEMNRDVISDPNNVPKGIALKVEGGSRSQPEQNGERVQIQKGDTLGKISSRVYGSPDRWKDLWENNRQLIKDPNKIYAGFYIYYQPQGSPMAQAPAAPAAAGEEARVPASTAAAPAADVPAAQ